MNKFIVLACVLLGGGAVSVSIFAQSTTPALAPAPATSSPLPPVAAVPVAHGIKPGDRLCLQQTGTLIRAKKGSCLPVAGRSYSADDLQRTGMPEPARALQRLDPSIQLGR